MKRALNYLKKIDTRLYIILFFCIVGVLRNIYHIFLFGFDYGSIATKVFIAMIVIYGAQALLIFARERKVWIISAIQAFFCFYVYEDFTFLPAINMIKSITDYFIPEMSFGWSKAFSMGLLSALFCLELVKTYLMYTLTEEVPRKKTKKGPAAGEETKKLQKEKAV
jgi:hypothetical protein